MIHITTLTIMEVLPIKKKLTIFDELFSGRF